LLLLAQAPTDVMGGAGGAIAGLLCDMQVNQALPEHLLFSFLARLREYFAL
jgi:hypothetical protein